MTDTPLTKEQKRQALQDKFTAKLAKRVHEIGSNWKAVSNDLTALSTDHLFYRQIHSLAGSAGSFGYQRLGNSARELEKVLLDFLQSQYQPDELIKRVEFGLYEMQMLASSGADRDFNKENSSLLATTSPTRTGDGSPPHIYIFEDDQELVAAMRLQLELFGYQVSSFENQQDFLSAQKTKPADAVIIDIVSDKGPLHGVDVASKLGELEQPTVPIVFISVRDDWQARLAALRAGSDAYLIKPLDFTQLIEQLEALLDREPEEPYSVIIVEDDVLLAEHYEATLQAAGMSAVALTNPEKLPQTLAETKPDVVLMDLYLDNCTGTEAARIIRQQSIYQSMPILFLSTETALLTQLGTLKQGGDNFIQKPVTDQQLIEMIAIYSERSRALKQQMTQDSMTGLLNHINFKLALKHEILMAQRRNSSLVVAMLDIDHFKTINDTYGHLMGDRVIKSIAWLMKQRLRNTDIIARYGGEEFGVVLPDATLAECKVLLKELLKQFSAIQFMGNNQSFTVTLSAGIAECPPYTEPDTIIAEADAALYQAKQAGRNRIFSNNDYTSG